MQLQDAGVLQAADDCQQEAMAGSSSLTALSEFKLPMSSNWVVLHSTRMAWPRDAVA